MSISVEDWRQKENSSPNSRANELLRMSEASWNTGKKLFWSAKIKNAL